MGRSIWILALSMAASGCAGGKGASSAEIEKGRNVAATGALIYERNCQHCHGENGEGGDKAPAILGRKTLQNSDFATAQDLFVFLADKMPADNPGGLDIGQYWNLATFMIATMGKKIPDNRLSESNAEDVRIKKK